MASSHYIMPVGANRRKVSLVETFLTVYKTPIGYLRVIQVILSISCLTLISCWGITVTYSCRSSDGLKVYNHNINTFKLSQLKLQGCDGERRALWHDNDNASSNAGFFYVICTLGLLYSLATTVFYTFFWTKYIAFELYTMLDLVFSFFISLLLLIAASVWWGGAATVLTAGSDHNIRQLLTDHSGFWDLQPEGLQFIRQSNAWVLYTSVLFSWILTCSYFASFFYVARCLFRKLSFEYDETGL